MMDDIAEQQDVAKEISDAISNPVAFGQDADEDELEKELEELQQEQLDKELLGIDTTTDELPAVPTAVPVAPSKTRTSNYYSYNTINFLPSHATAFFTHEKLNTRTTHKCSINISEMLIYDIVNVESMFQNINSMLKRHCTNNICLMLNILQILQFNI